MTGIAVEIITKETVGSITENITTIIMIVMIAIIIANLDVATREVLPGGPD
jgi:hypothetical protein